VVDFDGVPLMKHLTAVPRGGQPGFSDAAKFHKARVMAHKARHREPGRTKPVQLPPIVAVDLETTGLTAGKDEIMSIGAVKQAASGKQETFYELIKIDRAIPQKIVDLTGLSAEQLVTDGTDLVTALAGLRAFVKDAVFVGYNFRFDEAFLVAAFKTVGESALTNKAIDLMPTVKKANSFLDNYRLETVLADFEIDNSKPHNSLADAQATFLLATKLIKNGDLQI